MCGCSEMTGGGGGKLTEAQIKKMSYAQLVTFLKRQMKKT